jgi:branched-chain amino acid transport system permease protein
MIDALEVITSGLTLGSIYALIALGVVIIIKASDRINFAHGEMVMVGAVTAYIFRVTLGLPFPAAFALAVAVTFLSGLLIERVAYRPLLASPLNMVLASVAVSLLLQNLSLRFWGEDARAFPPVFSEAPVRIAGFGVVPEQWATIGAALLCLIGFELLFRRTRVGLAMRAVMLDRATASLMGVDVARTIGGIYGASAALGAAAGILVAPLIQVQFNMGFILVKAFVAACVGGIYSIRGAILGGLAVGVAEALLAAYVSSAYRDAILYAVLIAVLLLRPEGLLGRR